MFNSITWNGNCRFRLSKKNQNEPKFIEIEICCFVFQNGYTDGKSIINIEDGEIDKAIDDAMKFNFETFY